MSVVRAVRRLEKTAGPSGSVCDYSPLFLLALFPDRRCRAFLVRSGSSLKDESGCAVVGPREQQQTPGVGRERADRSRYAEFRRYKKNN
jgi:hypothetical protein